MPGPTVQFLREFLTAPRRVGALAPSSSSLARSMTEWIDWERARVVVECGPGTGAVTREILTRLRGDARLFAVEVQPRLARVFHATYPGVPLVEGSAADLPRLCRERGHERVDAVISSLPWASFNEDTQRQCLSAIAGVLREGGQFVTFAYLQGRLLGSGRRFPRLLSERFREVGRSRVTWWNLPPAFVYRCRR